MKNSRRSLRYAHALSAVVAVAALQPIASAAQEAMLPYGSRGGMEVTITSRAGIGTSKAVIGIKHTRQNALSFCEGYEMTSSKACVDRVLSDIKIRKSVTANCKSGQFTDSWGSKFKFVGHSKSGDTEYGIVDLTSGSTLDGSSASDYGPRLTIFTALCPNRFR